ncbi:MAG TPA: hypothetical protein VNN80_17320 [Polyangiaceae bacterium]|nr:hypothetical protein [Polyangiaceae bacterium]HWP04478.1 hypothetical protein [Polyangiaceae bacterium]
MSWLLLAVGFCLSGCAFIAFGLRQLDRRSNAIDQELAELRESARRAHIRADNHDRQIAALGKELGWSDDRAKTRVIKTESDDPLVIIPFSGQ